MENRSGFFIKQPTGYSSFVPKKLPPVPNIEFDQELISLLSLADRKLGRLDGITQTLPNADLSFMLPLPSLIARRMLLNSCEILENKGFIIVCPPLGFILRYQQKTDA